MTSPQVSEQEVEAAERAFGMLHPSLEDTDRMRRALAAAAQVRERAGASDQQKLRLVEMVLSFETPEPDAPFPIRKLYANAVVANLLGILDRPEPVPTPIYGATEPDSGPDVLGERKGEE